MNDRISYKSFTPDLSPKMPVQQHGIGIIGAGGIVRNAHLPAYRRAGWTVPAIASRNKENVAQLAGEWQIPNWYTDWHDLLENPAITVIDVSYPFDEERLAIVAAAAQCGKHILMQKPLAHSWEAAIKMVELAADAGVQLAVNQNARWSPQYHAAQLAISQGLLGDVHFFLHEMQNNQDSQRWFTDKWYAQQANFQIIEYAVHHLDLARFWLGKEPLRVKASLANKPGQISQGEMISSINLEYPHHELGVIIDNNAAYPTAPIYSRFRIEGSHGMLTGEAMGNPSLTVYSDFLEKSPQPVILEGNWFPDAFIGTMGEFLCAIEEERESSISGRDNLSTLKLVFDAYASLADH